jgi:serine/threonine-protein kinase
VSAHSNPKGAPVFEGKYRADREIGRGGFGVVYLGTDLALQRKVAIKVMHEDLSDPNARERFAREAQILAALEHPNIIPVHAYGNQDGMSYFVMKFLDGPALSAHEHARGRSFAEVVGVLEPIFLALQHAHDKGVTHRDLKPENIRFAGDGTPMLLDFGIARDEGLDTMTAAGQTMGTPYYMSPEQAKGQRAGAASDQYAMAVMLFELLTETRPFVGETPMSVLFQHVSSAPPSLKARRPDLPKQADAVLHRALAKEVEDRFASMRDFLQALRQSAGIAPGVPAPRAAADSAHARTMTGAAVGPQRFDVSDAAAETLPPESVGVGPIVPDPHTSTLPRGRQPGAEPTPVLPGGVGYGAPAEQLAAVAGSTTSNARPSRWPLVVGGSRS